MEGGREGEREDENRNERERETRVKKLNWMHVMWVAVHT